MDGWMDGWMDGGIEVLPHLQNPLPAPPLASVLHTSLSSPSTLSSLAPPKTTLSPPKYQAVVLGPAKLLPPAVLVTYVPLPPALPLVVLPPPPVVLVVILPALILPELILIELIELIGDILELPIATVVDVTVTVVLQLVLVLEFAGTGAGTETGTGTGTTGGAGAELSLIGDVDDMDDIADIADAGNGDDGALLSTPLLAACPPLGSADVELLGNVPFIAVP
ncbi:MAG: hypothetical protein M1830_001170, partial [Pleopsidium flavum]